MRSGTDVVPVAFTGAAGAAMRAPFCDRGATSLRMPLDGARISAREDDV
jgi:hypothetical protein